MTDEMVEKDMDMEACETESKEVSNNLEIHRTHTDFPCFLIFATWLIMMVAISVIGLLNGNPFRLIAPKDTDRRACGFDEMKDKSVLIYGDLSKCLPKSIQDLYQRWKSGYLCDTPQVCIEKCPEEYQLVASLPDKDKYCVSGKWKPPTLRKKKVPIDCVGYMLPTVSVFGRCLPLFVFSKKDVEEQSLITTTSSADVTLEISTVSQIPTVTKWKDGEDRELDLEKIRNGLEALGHFLGMTQKKDELIRDVEMVGIWFAFYFSLPFVFSMMYIWLVRHFAFPLLMTIVMLLMVGSATTTFVTVQMYRDPTYSLNQTFGNNSVYTFVTTYVQADERKLMLAFCIMFAIFTLIVFILSCCIFTGLRLACKCMAFASKIILKNLSLYIFPTIPWILQMIAFIWFILTITYLVSINCENNQIHLSAIGNLTCKAPTNTNPPKNSENKLNVGAIVCQSCDSLVKLFICIFLFGYIWVVYFIIGFGQLTISICFSTFYWSQGENKSSKKVSIMSSMELALKYHAGSIALGAFLISLVQFIRVILEFLSKRYDRFKVENKWFSRFVEILRVTLCLVNSLLQRLNESAYIIVSSTGKGFCHGVRKTMNLFMESTIKILTIWNSITFIVFLGECCIAIATGYFSFLHMKYFFGAVENPVIFCFLIGCFGYLFSAVILDVYSVGVKTVFFCLTEDIRNRNGSCVPEEFKREESRLKE